MGGDAVRLLPREEEFFDLFVESARRARDAAGHLRELFGGPPERVAWCVEEIKRLEHEADRITDQVTERLARTFITPLDREDIHLLAADLDDVIDRINDTARRVQIFRVGAAPAGVAQVVDVIQRISAVLLEALGHLRDDHEEVIRRCVEAKKLEEEGDLLHHQLLERLFEEEKDPIRLLKWKEIYENLEAAIDEAKDVANDLQAIAIKHA
jgi:hypothetical protein